MLERFLRYVQVDTQSDDDSETYPSTAKQLDLGKMLARRAARDRPRGRGADRARLRLRDARRVERADGRADRAHGHELRRVGREREAAGRPGLRRRRHRPPGRSAQGACAPSENPILAERKGHDIVTTDGTTLLGADDKAGIAEIMGAVAYLAAHPEIEHAPIRVGFTVDEEVGRGVDHFDIEKFGADFAYTLDGSEIGRIDDETFSASEVRIRIEGHSVHPGTSKDKMVNAIKLAARIVERLPQRRAVSPRRPRDARVRPSDADRRHDRRGGAPLHRARLRRAEARGAREPAALARRRDCEGRTARDGDGDRRGELSQHEGVPRRRACGDRGGARKRRAARASSRGASRSAAEPTARC